MGGVSTRSSAWKGRNCVTPPSRFLPSGGKQGLLDQQAACRPGPSDLHTKGNNPSFDPTDMTLPCILISIEQWVARSALVPVRGQDGLHLLRPLIEGLIPCQTDRKSTRLNSSHQKISYAVFCL